MNMQSKRAALGFAGIFSHRGAALAMGAIGLGLCATPARADGSDSAMASAFRPRLKFAKSARCFPLSYQEITPTASTADRDGLKKRCNGSYNQDFVIFASVKRPGGEAPPDSARITYGVAFGWQNGTFKGLTQDVIDMFADAGDHGEDAQYLVVDVVGGGVASVWADLHKGYYTRVRSQLTMYNDRSVTAWVGAYYHPLKLVDDTTSVCSVWSAVPGGLQALCAASCKVANAKSCGDFDSLMNWGDPVGATHEGGGKLVMVEDACQAGASYTSPDGVTYSGTQLDAMKAYIGCSGDSTSGAWSGYFKKKSQYTDPYGLKGCKSGDKSGGDICNGTIFGSDQTWTTFVGKSRGLEPAVVGSADVDYAAGGTFNDIALTSATLRSLTIRSGKRVDAVAATYADNTSVSHGGSGGGAHTLDGLDKDPVVSVTLCEGTKDGKARAGKIQLRTAGGRSFTGGQGTQNCRTIAPPNRRLQGFYGRSGSEVDVLGTFWGPR